MAISLKDIGEDRPLGNFSIPKGVFRPWKASSYAPPVEQKLVVLPNLPSQIEANDALNVALDKEGKESQEVESNRHKQTQQIDTNTHNKQTQTDTNEHKQTQISSKTDTTNKHKQTQGAYFTQRTPSTLHQELHLLDETDVFSENQIDTNKHKQTQISPVSVSEEVCVSLIDDLCLFDGGGKQTQEGAVSVLNEICVSLETDTTNKHKQTQIINQTDTNSVSKKNFFSLPTSYQQVQILSYLADQQSIIGLGHTPKMKRKEIALALGISTVGINNQLNRLLFSQCLERLDSIRGRGDCGNIYRVPQAIVQKLKQTDTNRHKFTNKQTQQIDTNRHIKQTQTDTLSSSSYNKTTTTERENSSYLRRLEITCDRWFLENLGVGVSDLLQAWKAWEEQETGDLDSFLLSVEHLAFYLSTPASQSIREPKAYFMKNLRAGFYATPAGFISWDEKQNQAKLAATKTRNEALKAQKREIRALEFQNWLMELSNEKKEKILSSTGVAISFRSPAAAGLLKSAFMEEVGVQAWEME